MTDLVIRQAIAADAEALFVLISEHRGEGHLLPRALDEIERHAGRFVVCDVAGDVKACAELAPLSPDVAEVRSLVVSRDFRRVGLASRLVGELRRRAIDAGFTSLCAFTHDARFFVRQNFSIVPHQWIPEKVSTDCVNCPLFKRCDQYAVMLPLVAAQQTEAVRVPRRVAVA